VVLEPFDSFAIVIEFSISQGNNKKNGNKSGPSKCRFIYLTLTTESKMKGQVRK